MKSRVIIIIKIIILIPNFTFHFIFFGKFFFFAKNSFTQRIRQLQIKTLNAEMSEILSPKVSVLVRKEKDLIRINRKAGIEAQFIVKKRGLSIEGNQRPAVVGCCEIIISTDVERFKNFNFLHSGRIIFRSHFHLEIIPDIKINCTYHSGSWRTNDSSLKNGIRRQRTYSIIIIIKITERRLPEIRRIGKSNTRRDHMP